MAPLVLMAWLAPQRPAATTQFREATLVPCSLRPFRTGFRGIRQVLPSKSIPTVGGFPGIPARKWSQRTRGWSHIVQKRPKEPYPSPPSQQTLTDEGDLDRVGPVDEAARQRDGHRAVEAVCVSQIDQHSRVDHLRYALRLKQGVWSDSEDRVIFRVI